MTTPAAAPSAATTTASAPPATRPLAIATPEQRAKIKATAQAFEAQMVSMMLQPMFEGLSGKGPFGGGEGEDAYRSFMVDAIAKQTTKHGGVGLAAPVMREMLKMQGLQ